ncbi:MAG TPA: carboxypeptidase-like regulatory domain-containing protein [Acidobacteriaceae bacterium]|nr:carboxypeptidase-like regulatory domain-containing protein [Acidobacteriaceae bacterium]
MIKFHSASLLMAVMFCSLITATYGQTASEETPLASISGTVLDVNSGMVSGAQVTLLALDPPASRTVLSNDEGGFVFTELAPGRFKFTVASTGFEPYASSEIVLHAGERLLVPEFRLSPAATTTNIQVSVTQTELATEQLNAQEQQRVLGIFPNFYSSYIWDAAPMSSGQKYQLAVRSLVDPFSFVGTGVFAAAEQWQNAFPGYGQGAQGYAKRYGAAYADEALSKMIGSAILPSLLHQDPRYFYRGTGTRKARALYAISQAIICRGDNGRMQPNYSYVLGSFAAGGISNLYHPAGDRGAGLTISNGFLNVASHAIDNLAREFLFRKLTPKVPDYAQGKP